MKVRVHLRSGQHVTASVESLNDVGEIVQNVKEKCGFVLGDACYIAGGAVDCVSWEPENATTLPNPGQEARNGEGRP